MANTKKVQLIFAGDQWDLVKSFKVTISEAVKSKTNGAEGQSPLNKISIIKVGGNAY